jgi:hypothetical protein
VVSLRISAYAATTVAEGHGNLQDRGVFFVTGNLDNGSTPAGVVVAALGTNNTLSHLASAFWLRLWNDHANGSKREHGEQ